MHTYNEGCLKFHSNICCELISLVPRLLPLIVWVPPVYIDSCVVLSIGPKVYMHLLYFSCYNHSCT